MFNRRKKFESICTVNVVELAGGDVLSVFLKVLIAMGAIVALGAAPFGALYSFGMGFLMFFGEDPLPDLGSLNLFVAIGFISLSVDIGAAFIRGLLPLLSFVAGR